MPDTHVTTASDDTPPRPGSRIARLAIRSIIVIALLGGAMAFQQVMIATKPVPPKSETGESSKIVRVMTAEPVETQRSFRGFGTARAKRAADITAEIDAVVIERPIDIDPGVTVYGPEDFGDGGVRAGQLIARLNGRDFDDIAEAAQKRIDAISAQIDGIVVERESLQDRLDLADEAVRLAEVDLERLRAAIGDQVENPAEIERRLQQLTVTKRDAARIRESLRLLPSRAAALEAQLAEQNASLRTAQLNVERTSIRAPFEGVLQSVDYELGERVNRGQVVARLVDLSTIEIPIRLPVAAALDVSPGASVVLVDDSLDGSRAWTGEIARIAPEVDAQTRTLIAFVEVKQRSRQTEDALLPGTFVRALVAGQSREERLVIPRPSLSDDRVWIVSEAGKLEYRAAKSLFSFTGYYESFDRTERDWVALDSRYGGSSDIPALQAGDRVVLNPSQDLRPGRLVRTQEDLESNSSTLVSTPTSEATASEKAQ